MEKDLSGVRVALLSTGALFSAYKNMHSFYFTSIFSGDIFYRGRILELAPEIPENLNRASSHSLFFSFSIEKVSYQINIFIL